MLISLFSHSYLVTDNVMSKELFIKYPLNLLKAIPMIYLHLEQYVHGPAEWLSYGHLEATTVTFKDDLDAKLTK